MTSVWAGYRYVLFTFLLLNPAFVLILSAQSIETGGLVDGGRKSHVYTLIVSIFNTLFIGLVLWFELVKRVSVISEVRWELIWVATVALFDIIGVASIALNRPASNTCTRSDSHWNICNASGGVLALLILAALALTIHAFALVIIVVRQSGKTMLNVWLFMARDLPSALRPPPPVPASDFAPGITGPLANDMVEIDLGPPKSLPPVPDSVNLAEPPPVAYGGRRDPFTFSSVSSLLNPTPRQGPEREARTRGYQLYDAPVTPIPVDRPPVQKAFERVSSTGSRTSAFGIGGVSISSYFASTPVYERFARGGRDSSAPPKPSPPPPVSPSAPRRREGDFVPWHARTAEEEDVVIRRAKTQTEGKARQVLVRDPSTSQTLPTRPRPPRVPPGSLPNPNAYRMNRA